MTLLMNIKRKNIHEREDRLELCVCVQFMGKKEEEEEEEWVKTLDKEGGGNMIV